MNIFFFYIYYYIYKIYFMSWLITLINFTKLSEQFHSLFHQTATCAPLMNVLVIGALKCKYVIILLLNTTGCFGKLFVRTWWTVFAQRSDLLKQVPRPFCIKVLDCRPPWHFTSWDRLSLLAGDVNGHPGLLAYSRTNTVTEGY